MPDKIGYVKPWRGKTMKVPRDTVLCHGVRVKRSVIVVPEVGIFVGPTPCSSSPSRRKRSKKRKSTRVSSSFSRYREENPEFTQSGALPAGYKVGTFSMVSNGNLQSKNNVLLTGALPGRQESRKTWDSLNSGPPYTSSGPFASVHSIITGSGLRNGGTIRNTFSQNNWWEYTGSFADDNDWFADSTANYLPAGVPQVTGYDTLAWDRLKPRVEHASAAQFIYELRDLPGSLKTSLDTMLSTWRLRRGGHSHLLQPKTLADNFVNHEFGWAPFVGDLYKFYTTTLDIDRILADLTAKNGQWQRRRAVLDENVTQNLVGRRYSPGIQPFGFNIQGLCNDMVVDGIQCKGYFDLTQVIEQKTWAVGHFTFYRPEFDMNDPNVQGTIGGLRRLLTVYGLRINPTLIWKLTPWTWAVDWFTHAGDYIRRLDDFTTDGIVSRNLCIMRTFKRTLVKTCVVNFASGRRTFQFTRSLETKVRKVADSPYGFDLTWNNLSIRQYAILASIGITRGGNSGFIARGA